MQTILTNFDFEKFKEYVVTYPDSFLKMSSSKTQIYDMLYGIAVSIDKQYEGSNGFDKFKEELALALIRS